MTPRDHPLHRMSDLREVLEQNRPAIEAGLRDAERELAELADAINERGLYEKRDGSRVDPSQIHARANKYQQLFEKDGRRLRLAE